MSSPKPILEILLLAAGYSSRMGKRNKLLMPFRGQPLVRHIAEQLIRSDLGPVTVDLFHNNDISAIMLPNICGSIWE